MVMIFMTPMTGKVSKNEIAMKKTLFHIGMLAVAAFAFVACNKGPEGEIQKAEASHTITVNFGKVATKTMVTEGESSASYKWNSDDWKYLHVYENGTEGTITEEGFTLNDEHTVATLTVSFTGNAPETINYTAKYALEIAGSGNPHIQGTQYPKADNYDPSADILISKATDDVTGLTERPSTLQFTMGRPVTVNKMTLTGLSSEELVKTVEFELDKHVVGYYGTTLSGGKKLTFDYTKQRTVEDGETVISDRSVAGIAPDSDGNFPVYFISPAIEDAGIVSVVVTTDKNVYTKSSSLDPNPFDGKTITFAIGTMKRFTMAMSGYGEEISTGVVYTQVESADDLYDGAQYIIAAADADRAIQSYVSGNNHKAVTIEKNTTNKTVTIDNTIDAEVFILNIAEGGYTIQNASNTNYYLNSSTSNNRLTESANSEVFNISFSNGVASIVSKTNTSRGHMYYNSNSVSGNIFNCYADKSDDTSGDFHLLALYVDLTTCVELEEAELAYSVSSPIVVAWADKDNFVKPILTNPHSLTVTYTSSNPNVATVDEDTGDISFVGDGTTTITASSARTSTYKAGSAEYQITVTGAPAAKGTAENPYTVAEALAIIDGYSNKDKSASEVYVSGIVANVGSYSSSYHSVTYDISDNGTTASTLNIYSGKFVANTNFTSNEQIEVGDEVIVYGYLYLFESTQEMYQNNYIYSLNGKTKVLTSGSLSAVADDANLQITVTWGAATGTTSSISYEVTCGTQSYNANAAGNHTFTMADYGEYDVTVVATASDALSAETGTKVTLSNPGAKKDYYKLVTSVSEITAGTYVVGALRSTSATNAFYFAKASVSSGDWVVSDGSITVTENEGVRRFETSNLPSGAVEFTLTGDNTEGFTISNGSNYLYYTAASNRKLAFAAAGSSQKWTVSAKSSPLITGGVVLKAKGTQNYTISENSTAVGAIRGYASTTEYRAIYLFKKVNE